MTHPCFNAETHTDCPRRHGGCAIDCPDWAKYSAEMAKEYKRRARISEQKMAIDATRDRLIANNLRRVIDNRTTGFTKRRKRNTQ